MVLSSLPMIRNYWMTQPFRGRYAHLQKQMKKLQIKSLWIEDLDTIFHLTYQRFSQAILIAHANQTFELWLDSRYYSQSVNGGWTKHLWTGKSLDFLFDQFKGKTLSIDSTLSCQRFHFLQNKARGKAVHLKLIDFDLDALRMVKDKSALEALSKASKLADEGFRYVRALLAPGVTEQEMAAELQIFWLRHGGEKVSFDPIIAFGDHTAHAHHQSGSRRLRSGDIVLMDMGVSVDGYQSDMTRTFFFARVNDDLVKPYEAVKKAYHVGIESCQSGVSLLELDAKVRASLRDDGFDKYFTHSLGHGVGIRVHEPPFFRVNEDLTLLESMVLTIEPGVYLEGLGGIRLEDTVVVQKKGCRILSSHPICEEVSKGVLPHFYSV